MQASKPRRLWAILLIVLLGGLALSALSPMPRWQANAAVQPDFKSLADGPTPSPGGNGKPAQVYVGAYINNIQDLDLQKYNYDLDVYVWTRWSSKADLEPSLEAMNLFEAWSLVETPLYDKPQKLSDGSLLMVTRYQGSFNNPLPLAAYPFDAQNLLAVFEDSRQDAAHLQLVPDDPGIVVANNIDLPGYRLAGAKATTGDLQYPTTFGDTDLSQPESYSRVVFDVTIQRQVLAYTVKLIMPIFLVAMTGIFVFFIAAPYVDARIGMGITSLLTLVALQFTSNEALPAVDYLMLIDWLYLISYAFVIIALGTAVMNSRRVHGVEAMEDEVELKRYRDRDLRNAAIWLPAYILTCAAVFIVYLT